MRDFKGQQRTFTYKQKNNAHPDKVFPLLCPVRELDWLDGWSFRMIYSRSGLVEENCVFATPHHGTKETVWHVTRHDAQLYKVEFVRMTPEESVVRIQIRLEENKGNTDAYITYQYTGLSEEQNEYIQSGLESDFQKSMQWWEKSINYYLETGRKLTV